MYIHKQLGIKYSLWAESLCYFLFDPCSNSIWSDGWSQLVDCYGRSYNSWEKWKHSSILFSLHDIYCGKYVAPFVNKFLTYTYYVLIFYRYCLQCHCHSFFKHLCFKFNLRVWIPLKANLKLEQLVRMLILYRQNYYEIHTYVHMSTI